MKRLREKDVFFHKKPKAYTFSLASYLKSYPFKERFRPSYILWYYSFTYLGARLYYRMNSYRVRRESRRIQKLAKAAETDRSRKLRKE